MATLSWRAQRPGELVLRAWLGVTFAYAGVQKLTDPGFFTKGSITYIGTQLHGFAHGSPIAPLLDLAGHAPAVTGAAVAFTEILVGVATLAGVAPATAATVGLLLSLSLWLSASWHVHPYFLGSDSIYAVAWLAYLVSLPAVRARIASLRGGEQARPARPARTLDDQRRQVIRGGAVAAGGLLLGGVAATVGTSRKKTTPGTQAGTRPTGVAPASGGTAPSSAASGATNAGGEPVIAQLSALAGNGSVDFTSPSVGPSVVVELADGTPVAFSRTCTHAGAPRATTRAAA